MGKWQFSMDRFELAVSIISPKLKPGHNKCNIKPAANLVQPSLLTTTIITLAKGDMSLAHECIPVFPNYIQHQY